MIPPIQSQNSVAQPQIKVFPPDEEFIPQFHEKPYVFEQPTDWQATNCSLTCTNKEIHFVEVNYCKYSIYLSGSEIGCIEKKNESTGWSLKTRTKEYPTFTIMVESRFKTLAEAVENCLIIAPPFSGIHYFRGIIDNNVLDQRPPSTQNFNEIEILREEPIGSFFIVKLFDKFNPFKAYIKLNESEVGYLFLLPESVQIQTESNIKLLDSGLKQIQTRYPNLKQISLCQSLLDISVLKHMSDNEITRTINNWTPEFLKGIKHVSYSHENSDGRKGLIIIIELLLHLAMIECVSIKFSFEKTYIYKDITSDNSCRNVLSRMRQELQGEALNWAIDNFLEVVFSKTNVRQEELAVPVIDPSWHEIYNNEKTQPNIQIQLRDSSKIICVHTNNLARFSPMLKTWFNGPIKPTYDKPINFPDCSDSIVEKFLLMCYGNSPDFSNCDLLELIKFADYLQSPLLMDVANQVFNTRNIDSQALKNLIDLGLWKSLRHNSHFFELVGTKWVNIVKTLPIEERERIRECFLKDWGEYFRFFNRNLIKV